MRKLTEEEKGRIRKKPVMLSRHFVMRWMFRLRFRTIESMLEYGDVYQEGRNKFRAVLPIRDKIVFVIFYDHEDYIQPITCNIASRKKRFG